MLRHVADLREAEIAQVMGVGRSTMSRTLATAHERLAEVVAEPRSPAERAAEGGRP